MVRAWLAIPVSRFRLAVGFLLTSWLFRFEYTAQGLFLDRWTGDVIPLPVSFPQAGLIAGMAKYGG